jgi:hypothetical protein
MNARVELEGAVRMSKSRIVCATITPNCTFAQIDESKMPMYNDKINLMYNYTPEELEEFMNKLDFDYDDGYGMQYLDGTVWLENGTWLERGEYDGSEWWYLKSTPAIPEFLMK